MYRFRIEVITRFALAVLALNAPDRRLQPLPRGAVDITPRYRKLESLFPQESRPQGSSSFLSAEAIAEVKRAQESDPLSLGINANVGLVLYWARE